MQITRKQWDSLIAVKSVVVSYLSQDEKNAAVVNAIKILTVLHKFETIEGIKDMHGALKMLKDQCERVLRDCKAPIPKYIPHPLFAKQFLDLDLSFLSEDAPAAPKAPAMTQQDALNELLKGL